MAVIHNCSWLKFFGYGYKDKAQGVMGCVNFVLNVFMIVPEGGFNVPELFTIVILATLWVDGENQYICFCKSEFT